MFSVFLNGLSILGEKWIMVLGAASVACLGCSLCSFLSRDLHEEKRAALRSILWPAIFFAISLLLRLAFLTEVYVPPYFDSVEHYRIIKELTAMLGRSLLSDHISALTPDYYHLGFHFLASFLAFGLHADPMSMILILGQVILAAIPIPIYYLIRKETGSAAAAFFGMLLAGFGWYMPGFAVNWGKYPALAGLLALEIALNIAYFITKKPGWQKKPALVGLLLLGILVSTLFHTRTLIVIAISIACWLIAGRVQAVPKIVQPFLVAGLLVFWAFVKREPLLNLTLEPYLGYGLWVTLAVLALTLFALIKFPRSAYFSLLFILFMFAALFIPIPAWFSGLENQTLLDRPFVEMVLYLPLSILGGLGLAGLLGSVANITTLPEKTRLPTRTGITVLLLIFASLMSFSRYDFYPSDCCNFVKYDDTIALDWLDKNLPPDAHILVAGTQLNVLPSGPSSGLAGTDAGIWIPALTGRKVSLAPFDSDFASGSTQEALCTMKIGYIYVGGTKQSFNTTHLSERKEWYERILFLPNVQLYRLSGCSR